MSHTPGPWFIHAHSVFAQIDKGSSCCVAELWTRGPGKDQHEDADCRLIAAAPDMLDALKDALQYMDALDRREAAIWKGRGHLRAVIAKAEGRS